MDMQDNILCGSACVIYILNEKKKKSNDINSQMFWITELAIVLFDNDIKNIELRCFNSNLYNDFLIKKNIDLKFSGFKFLDKMIKKNIKINQKKLDCSSLKEELYICEYIILCVQSSIFNNDVSMSGGHFIILDKFDENKVRIINPKKREYEVKYVKIDELIRCCKDYGSWRILIKGG